MTAEFTDKADAGPGVALGEMMASASPYELTLQGLIFPWWILALFHVVAGTALALVGRPDLALAWTAAALIADFGVQRLYQRWRPFAAVTDSAAGLRRIALVAACRSTLMMSGPVALALLTDSFAAIAVTGLTALSLIALAIACGWTSRLLCAAMATPTALGLALAVVPHLGGAPAAGVALALVSFATTAALIALGTAKNIGEWSQANDRTISAMAELRAALERSEAAERRLRIAAGIAEMYVYETDYVGRTIVNHASGNDFLEAPFDYDRMWRDPFHMVDPRDRERVEAAWLEAQASGAPYRVEYRVNRTDGREVWAFGTAELTRDETGRPLALVGALLDITERKRAELELIEARDLAEAGSRAKSEFLATISHEIRTPMNGVLGMAQAMARDELSDRQRGRLEVISRAGEMLLSLLNGVLDLSKIEAGKLELEVGEVDIAHIAHNAIEAFSAELADKDVALTLTVEPRADAIYAGDPARVRQVLFNLISNAVKFTERGAIAVTVAQARGALTLSVADTGIGISRAQQVGLFEKFVQADASTTRRFGGSGLGLAISQHLAGMMGGAIILKSRPGRGSTFTASLALPRLRDSDPIAPVTQEVEEPDTLPPLRVLAAEDNPINQLVLKTLLEQVGVEPVVVADGQQALDAWRTGAWDLILMDVQMPVMDGITAVQAIRQREAAEGRPRTPIIALTANVMAHQVDSYHAAGMDDVVGKPIQIEKLLQAMEACLAEAAETQPAEALQATG